MATSQDSFWERVGLQETDMATCIEAVKRKYDGHHVEAFEYQGYCSFTLLVSRLKEQMRDEDELGSGFCSPASVIVQIRPVQHALSLDVAWEASRMYPSLAPKIRALDVYLSAKLCVYELSRLPGVPLSRLLQHQLIPGDELRTKQETLITSLAYVVAKSWPVSATRKRRDSVLRPNSPLNKDYTKPWLCTGKVGSCIVQKLQKLAQELPDEWLQGRANTAMEELLAIVDYPVVLNHGDLIPSNILVNEQTWEITGLVDWAEAEYLPLGTCLYSLEHLLGYLKASSQGLSSPAFVFYDNAAQLRQMFWTTLVSKVPELGSRQDEVRVMRDVGILLWHGYAWDEGAIDRIVDEVNDGEELAKLRAFLRV